MAERPPEQEPFTRFDREVITGLLAGADFPCAPSLRRLFDAYDTLLAAYEDRSKAFEDAAADCVRLEGENMLLWSVIGSMPSSYIKSWSNESEAAFKRLPKQPEEKSAWSSGWSRLSDGSLNLKTMHGRSVPTPAPSVKPRLNLDAKPAKSSSTRRRSMGSELQAHRLHIGPVRGCSLCPSQFNDPGSDSLFVKLDGERCRCSVCGEVVTNSTEARDAHLNRTECHIATPKPVVEEEKR